MYWNNNLKNFSVYLQLQNVFEIRSLGSEKKRKDGRRDRHNVPFMYSFYALECLWHVKIPRYSAFSCYDSCIP